jgi:hypothetical protein
LLANVRHRPRLALPRPQQDRRFRPFTRFAVPIECPQWVESGRRRLAHSAS